MRIYDIAKKKLLRKVENKVCLLGLDTGDAGSSFILDIRIRYRQFEYARIEDYRRRYARVAIVRCL